MTWKIVLPLLAAVFAVGFSGIPGGASYIGTNDEGVQNALSFAVVQYNSQTNDVFLRQVVSVDRAQIQVVAGINYFITVQMVKTSCIKDNANGPCSTQTGPPYQCTFTVWCRPWLNDCTLTGEECSM